MEPSRVSGVVQNFPFANSLRQETSCLCWSGTKSTFARQLGPRESHCGLGTSTPTLSLWTNAHMSFGAFLNTNRRSLLRILSKNIHPADLEDARVTKKGVAAFGTQTGLCRHSNRSLFASGNSAGKRFGEARDRDGIFGDTGRFRVTETALSRVSGGKAAESQRLFRRRQETGIAQDCVVAAALQIGPVSDGFSLLTGKTTGNSAKIGPQD